MLKCPTFKREYVKDLLKEFKKFDTNKNGLLGDDEAKMLLVHLGKSKGIAKTFEDFDGNDDHMLSFVELVCGLNGIKIADLNNFADEEQQKKFFNKCKKYAKDTKLKLEELGEESIAIPLEEFEEQQVFIIIFTE